MWGKEEFYQVTTQKISVKDAEWLWAAHRNKAAEYYAKYYNETYKFTPEIGGSIIGHMLLTNMELLRKAYIHVHYDWVLAIHAAFGHYIYEGGNFDINYKLTPNTLSWLLLRSLSYQLTCEDRDRIIDGDWRAMYKRLDEEFKEPEASTAPAAETAEETK